MCAPVHQAETKKRLETGEAKFYITDSLIILRTSKRDDAEQTKKNIMNSPII